MPRTIAEPLTTDQIRGFWAAWAGWALDGMDSFIYALVLVPAPPRSLAALRSAGHPGQHRLLRRRALRRGVARIARASCFALFSPEYRRRTIGTPVALTSIAFLVGLALLPLAEETKGKELPA